MNAFKVHTWLRLFALAALLCIIMLAHTANCRKVRRFRRFGPPVVPFDRTNYDNKYFLSALPSDSLLSQSYPIRETLSSALHKSSVADKNMVSTEAEMHLNGSNQTVGLIQFRQVSDMWLTEMKGIVQQLPPKKSFFLIVHENKTTANMDCSNLGNHLNPFGQPHGDPAAFADVKTTKLSTHLGDLRIISTDTYGIAVIGFQSLHVSLFNDTASIVGHTIAIHELNEGKHHKDRVIACGTISPQVKVAAAKFQKSKKPKRFYF